MRIYGDLQSGNCYKLKLLCALLEIPHEWIAIDIQAGDTQSKTYLTKNPNGRVPLLELDDGKVLAKSNAILCYLATGSDLLPVDHFDHGKVMEWLFFEQYSHEPYIAVRRAIRHVQGMPAEREAEYKSKEAGGLKALAYMESCLSESSFLVGENLTIADISLYAYTHVADEAGFDLKEHPSILRWIARVEATPHFFTMPA
jgi:glutathione S-transferase